MPVLYIYIHTHIYIYIHIYHSASKRDRDKDSQRAISYYTKFIQNSQNGHFQPSKKV